MLIYCLLGWSEKCYPNLVSALSTPFIINNLQCWLKPKYDYLFKIWNKNWTPVRGNVKDRIWLPTTAAKNRRDFFFLNNNWKIILLYIFISIEPEVISRKTFSRIYFCYIFLMLPNRSNLIYTMQNICTENLIKNICLFWN